MSAPNSISEAVAYARKEINTMVDYEHISVVDEFVITEHIRRYFAQIFHKELFQSKENGLREALKRIWDQLTK